MGGIPGFGVLRKNRVACQARQDGQEHAIQTMIGWGGQIVMIEVEKKQVEQAFTQGVDEANAVPLSILLNWASEMEK